MKRSEFGGQGRAVLAAGVVLVACTAAFAAARPAAQKPGMPRAAGNVAMTGMEMFQTAAVPSEATAAKDLQSFLDQRVSAWQVRKVEDLGSEMTFMKGARIFVMDAMLDMKVVAAVALKESEVRNNPWIARLSGKRGENRVVRMRLTWTKKESGWKLRSIE